MTTCVGKSCSFGSFTARAFRKLLFIYVFSYFPFGFEGRVCDLIVSVSDHYLCFNFNGYFFLYFHALCYSASIEHSEPVHYDWEPVITFQQLSVVFVSKHYNAFWFCYIPFPLTFIA